MNFKEQLSKADAIPSLGLGGKSIKGFLVYSASNVKSGRSIVELGSWLGSTTSYMCIGVNISGLDIPIYSYDMWHIDKDYKRKAYVHNNLEFDLGHNIQEHFLDNIKDFGPEVIPVKTDVIEATWYGGKIGLFVDDIATGKRYTDHVIDTFFPSFVALETIIVYMDYYFYLDKKIEFLKYQKNVVRTNPGSFISLGRIGKSMASAFLYTGIPPIKIKGKSK